MTITKDLIDQASTALTRLARRHNVARHHLIAAMVDAYGAPIEKHYRVTEIANLFAVDRRTVNRWIESGTLPAIDFNDTRTGRVQWRVAHDDVEAFITAQKRRPRRRKVTVNSPAIKASSADKSSAKSSVVARRRKRNATPSRKHLV